MVAIRLKGRAPPLETWPERSPPLYRHVRVFSSLYNFFLVTPLVATYIRRLPESFCTAVLYAKRIKRKACLNLSTVIKKKEGTPNVIRSTVFSTKCSFDKMFFYKMFFDEKSSTKRILDKMLFDEMFFDKNFSTKCFRRNYFDEKLFDEMSFDEKHSILLNWLHHLMWYEKFKFKIIKI